MIDDWSVWKKILLIIVLMDDQTYAPKHPILAQAAQRIHAKKREDIQVEKIIDL